jgi:hypothetical protein
MMLKMLNEIWYLCAPIVRWLQVLLILPVGGSANNSLSIIMCFKETRLFSRAS